jgi:hypothetical protein
MEEIKANLSDLSVNPEASTNKRELEDLKKSLLSQPPLLGFSIGISSAPATDLDLLGLSEEHHDDIFIELNRYLLANGASLLYGGDLRSNGHTEILIELVGSYRFGQTDPSNRLQSFLAYPLYLSLTTEIEAKYFERVRFHRVAPPGDIHVDLQNFTPPDSPENLYIWARSLTAMRSQMEAISQARIFIGGLDKGYKGRAPGLLEEFLLAIDKGIPVYLLGGWGGVTRKLRNHLDGGDELRVLLGEIETADTHQAMQFQYEKNGFGDDMQWPKKLLQCCEPGWNILKNGLGVEENRQLSSSIHVHEAIYYVLKGLLNTLQRKTT